MHNTDIHISAHGSITTYVIGFLTSLVLTLAAYVIVANHMGTSAEIVVLIFGLAVLQLGVQTIFFLHFNSKSHSRWNLTVFLFTIMVVTIVVGGSLWIMQNLNTNMTASQLDAYMSSQN